MPSRQLKLDNVRISFSNLEEPKTYKTSPPRYSATFHIPKKSQAAKRLWEAVEGLAEEQWPGKGEKRLDEFKRSKQQFCIQDGDESDFESSHGMWLLTAHRRAKDGLPERRDRRNNPAPSGLIYDGCYVNAAVDPWTQTGENPGIRCGLVGVQFVSDGEAFGGARRGGDTTFGSLDVGDEDDDVLAAPAPVERTGRYGQYGPGSRPGQRSAESDYGD